MKKYILCFVLSAATAYGAYPTVDENSRAHITAVRSNENITIDGRLTESVWQGEGFNKLIEVDPVQGVRPTQQSEFWIAYDDQALYFAARFYDTSPDSIMARLVRRDYIWGDPSDGCVFYIDSYRDKRNGYFFYVSAAGTHADGLIENDVKQPNDLTWDAVWEGKPHIDKLGWTVEMKIPYSQLRFNEGKEQVWGVDVERFIGRNQETDMLVYTPRNESGFASRFPDLIGLDGINPPAQVELLPYLVGKASYIGAAPGDPFNPGHKYNPGIGLDVRAGLGSSLTLNGTVNPDFGQVEVDPAVVNLTDVESIFEEKRPFFTEGVSIYKFGGGGTNNNVSFNWPFTSIFYSRRIGRAPQGNLPAYDYADIPDGTHIIGAAKISGEIYDNWKIGTIHAFTQREYADISLNGIRSGIEIEPLTYYGVFRTQRDFDSGKEGLGILSTFTNRFFKNKELDNSINKNAFVIGSDGWTFLDETNTYVLTGWTAFSSVSGSRERMTALQMSPVHYFQRPDVSYISVDSSATSLTGYSGRLMLNKNRGRWTFNTAVGFISPGFEVNDLGFGSFSDYINAHFFTSYRWNDPTEFYQNCGINAAVFTSYDFGWDNTSLGYWLGSYLTRPDYSGVQATASYNPSTLNSRRTRGGPLTLNPPGTSCSIDINSDNRLWWVLYAGGSGDYGKDDKQYTIYTTAQLKVLPTLTLSIGPQFTRDIAETQWIGNFDDPAASETYNTRYVFAHLNQDLLAADIRADWILSPTLSCQVYIQPLIASGSYADFKYLVKPRSYDYNNYGENGSTLTQNKDGKGKISSYDLDPDGSGPAPAQKISNPDFRYISLRGNAVLRWEYLPGSALYLVWTQSRQNVEPDGQFMFGSSFNNLFSIRPDNIFMLKVTYWL